MSKIFTPSNRIQLTNVAVVRLKKGFFYVLFIFFVEIYELQMQNRWS
jgi:hypothetical protein